MQFADGTELETDIIVFSAGIRPRDELAQRKPAWRSASAAASSSTIDCRTSDPDIFAIGECALWNGKMFGLVAPGYQMAHVCAARLLGATSPRSPAPT